MTEDAFGSETEEDKGGAAPEPQLDERGWPLIRLPRTVFALNNADIGARGKYYAAMRAMSDEDFKAGRGLTVEQLVRDDARYPPKLARYVFGIGPREARTYACMEAEAVEVIRRCHEDFATKEREPMPPLPKRR